MASKKAASLGDELEAFSGYEMMGGFGGAGRSATLRKTVKKKKQRPGELSDGTFDTVGEGEEEFEVPPTPPARRQWEFDRSKLALGAEPIGEGNFGQVYVAKAAGLVPGEAETEVAIKTLTVKGKGKVEAKEAEEEFRQEIQVMKAVSGCEAIVSLLGICTEKSPFYMIMEFMSEGDLKDVLRKSRPKGSSKPAPFGAAKLAQMGADIAEGMAHLGGLSIGIIHRDLAARNCMVGKDLKVKVGDFGLTRKVYNREYYRMKNAAPLPIRWMAFESLEDGTFTIATDLWSFGVVLWEIVTFGKLPYADMENVDIYDELDNDYRMPAPPFCPAGFHEMMLECWETDPGARGSFEEKRGRLAAMATTLPADPITRNMYRGRAPNPAESAGADADEDGEDDSVPTYRPVYGTAGGGEEAGAYEQVAAPSDAYAVPASGEGAYGMQRAARRTVRRKEAAAPPEADVVAVASWIASKTRAAVDPTNLHGSLQSGEVLCQLANKLSPGSVPGAIYKGAGVLKKRENISKALDAFNTALGIADDVLFDVADLYDDVDMVRVVQCLAALMVKA